MKAHTINMFADTSEDLPIISGYAPTEAATMPKANNMDIRLIVFVSSGTLAGMCGRNKYEEVEAIQNMWVEHELAHPTPYGSGDFFNSWEKFKATNEYRHYLATTES
jgi:hypothetical protein